jgi:uncharacterized membrane protein
MDKLSFLLRYPYVYLLLAILIWSLALIETCTGDAITRWRVVNRDEEPKSFRAAVLMHILGGIFFIGCFLFRFYRL